MNESSQAAIFDFDGILFRKGSRWKIVNARLGMSGSLVSCEKGLKLFQNVLLSNPEAKLDDYFIIEEYSPDGFPANGSVDITPIENLIKTADNHRFRGRDIYILSSNDFKKFYFIVERIFSKYRQYPNQTNPFNDCKSILSLAEKLNGNSLNSDNNEASNKINFLQMLLKNSSDASGVNPEEYEFSGGQKIARYNKIFYYHTQSELVSVIDDFINSRKESFLDGKNALIPSYITNMKVIAGAAG